MMTVTTPCKTKHRFTKQVKNNTSQPEIEISYVCMDCNEVRKAKK